MPSHSAARSLTGRGIGAVLGAGKQVLQAGVNKLAGKGKKNKAPYPEEGGSRNRYGFNTQDRNYIPAKIIGAKGAKSNGKGKATEFAEKLEPKKSKPKVDAFSTAKQRGSGGVINTAHLEKIKAAKQEYEQHREARERLRTMTDLIHPGGRTLTGRVGLSHKRLRRTDIAEGLGKLKTVEKLSKEKAADRVAVFWDKLHEKSNNGIVEFVKGKGAWRRFKRNVKNQFTSMDSPKGQRLKARIHREGERRMGKFEESTAKLLKDHRGKMTKINMQFGDKIRGIQKFHNMERDENTVMHSLSGIVEFIKSYRKTKALKGGRRRLSARVSSHTYRQTAPAVKRSAKAKMRPKKAATKPKGSGMATRKSRRGNAIDKMGRRKYRPATEYDRGLTMNEHDDNYGMDECEEMSFAPFEPERSRGYYGRDKKVGRHTPGVATDTF